MVDTPARALFFLVFSKSLLLKVERLCSKTEEKVWSRSREFRVTASSSARKWNVNVSDTSATVGRAGHVDYVPTYQEAQLFKWRGYWVEIRRNKGQLTYNPAMGQQVVSSMYLT